MLITLRDDNDKVVAYTEYAVVDKDGKAAQDGKYCFARETWIHKDYRNEGLLQKMILIGCGRHPQLRWIYYERNEDGKLRIYDIWRLTKYGL